jgi:DNA repair protein RecN (Recombination protein N)
MLERINTYQYGVLQDLELELQQGLVVITGESGSGKSSLLRAIEAPWEGSKAGEGAWVETQWTDGPSIGKRWKSTRSYPTIDAMRCSKEGLPAKPYFLVKQGASQYLRRPSTARSLLDQDLSAWTTYSVAWSKYEFARDAYQEHKHALDQLNRAGLEGVRDELSPYAADAAMQWEELQAEEKRLEAVYAKTQQAQGWARLLHDGEVFDWLGQWLQGADDELLSAYETLYNHYHGSVPQETVTEDDLNLAHAQVYQYQQLIYRYGEPGSWAQTLSEAEEQLTMLSQGETRLAELKAEWLHHKGLVLNAAKDLTKARTKRAIHVSKKINTVLDELELQDSMLSFRITAQDKPGPNGQDHVVITWDPNKTGATALGEGASGGEISRVMLAVQTITGTDHTTYIYDEIDSGLSGQALLKVGEYLRKQSTSGQVILITHSPVLAAHADQHVVLKKIGGKTKAKSLDKAERSEELIRLMGASDVSEQERETLLSVLQKSQLKTP